MCFLDAYSGYHQIKMTESNQAATTFSPPYRPFCFNTMPFGLKNAGATYQRTIQTCLEKQIGKIVEAYVDDVVIKTRHVESLIDDLRLTFVTSEHMTLSSIRKNVFSVFPPESYWASSFPIEELKQTQLKSELCHSWLPQQISNKSRN